MTDVTNEEHKLREQLEAEREARHEAERLAAENARLLYDRQDELELLEMVAAASNEATAIEPALGAAIVHVCAHMRWPVGHAYLVDPATGACARAASGTSRTRSATRPSARPASSRGSSRGCRATSWPPASRRG